MGAQEEAWAWQQPLDLATKAVLVRLAQHAMGWRAHVTAAGLSREMNCSGRTVQHAVERLRQKGLLSSRKRGAFHLKRSVVKAPKRSRPAGPPRQPVQASMMPVETPDWMARFNAFGPNKKRPLTPAEASSIRARFPSIDLAAQVLEFIGYWQSRLDTAEDARSRKVKLPARLAWPETWAPYGRLARWLENVKARSPAPVTGVLHEQGNPECRCGLCLVRREEMPALNQPEPERDETESEYRKRLDGGPR